MRIAFLTLAFALALSTLGACGGKQQTLTIVNGSPRPIVEYYIYKVGSADHGKSHGTIAPDARVVVKLPFGYHEVEAISDLVIIDDHTRDKYTASQAVELTKRSPVEVIFHDSTQKPPGVDKPNTLGAVFHVAAPKPKPEADSDGAPPADEPAPTPPSE